MKRIYLVLVAIFFSAGAFAQQIVFPDSHVMNAGSIHHQPNASVRGGGGTHVWLEYDSADAYQYGDKQIHLWSQCIMNKRFPANMVHDAATLTPFQRAIVKFEKFYDVITNDTIDRSTITNIVVDSIYAALGHENNSGQKDTLVVRIIDLTTITSGQFAGIGYPGTNTLWSDTIFTNSNLSPHNNYRELTVESWKPNFFNAMNGFAIELDYYAPLVDTLAIVAGFNNLGGSANCTVYRANVSNFYPNSFLAWTDHVSQYPLLPWTDGHDSQQDCDGNGSFDPNIDGYSYFQDVIIGAYISINVNVGLNNEMSHTGIGLSQNSPNPVHNTTDIKYELVNNAKDVTLYVSDIVGSKVMEIKEGNKSSGKYHVRFDASGLAKGVYTYTLRADGSQVTRKMIVE